MEIGLCRHVENADSDIQSLRQELIQMKQQINSKVSVKIAVCNNQIFAEKQEYHSKFLKVNRKIDKLKESLSVNLTNKKTINNSNDDCPIITLTNGSNQGGTESLVITNN
jgi:peptide methionine sulfoxide reductase MsrA